jgi:hypothetical protein
MKNTILLFLFLFPLYFSVAQSIKGTVVNDAGQKISNANIYIDGTKIGTVSKEDGSFILSLPEKVQEMSFFKKKIMKRLQSLRPKL